MCTHRSACLHLPAAPGDNIAREELRVVTLDTVQGLVSQLLELHEATAAKAASLYQDSGADLSTAVQTSAALADLSSLNSLRVNICNPVDASEQYSPLQQTASGLHAPGDAPLLYLIN